jgi:adenosylcobinamide-GDP ribazoletransferase
MLSKHKNFTATDRSPVGQWRCWRGELALALALLTRIPVPSSWFVEQSSRSRAVLWYPAVGVLIGLLLCLFVLLCSYLSLPSAAVLPVEAVAVVCFWVFLSGALHLDGLADALDALAAGHKDTDTIHRVLKDPNSGAMAIVGLILLLLFKTSLLLALLALAGGDGIYIGLMFAPLLARLLVVHYMASTPYVRAVGMAAGIDLATFKFPINILTLLCGLAVWWVSSLTMLAVLVSALAGWCCYWRRLWIVRIGGYSGDCAGALLEVAEIITLLVFLICRDYPASM